MIAVAGKRYEYVAQSLWAWLGLVVQRKGSGPVTLRRAGTGRVGVNRRKGSMQ